MSPKVLTSLVLITSLAGCTSVDKADWKSKAAREFDTQKQAVCCFVGMKNLPDESKPKTDTEKAELIAQIDALKAALAAKEANLAAQAGTGNEKSDLARQLEASRTSLTLTGEEKSNLARQLAAAQADLAAKENERAEFARQLEALKAQPTKAPAAKVVLREQELFDSGSATLKPEGIKVVTKLAETLKGYPDTVIRSEGHTDDRPISTGRFPSNWELSSARATEVVRSLQKQGISPERLIAIGYGDTRPAAPNTDAESRAKNRRVEIIVVPAPATTAGAQ
jgi:flagellar motor protein MotB